MCRWLGTVANTSIADANTTDANTSTKPSYTTTPS